MEPQIKVVLAFKKSSTDSFLRAKVCVHQTAAVAEASSCLCILRYSRLRAKMLIFPAFRAFVKNTWASHMALW